MKHSILLTSFEVHKNKGYSDDPHLGSFLDAFCDKVVNVSVLWSIIFLADYSQMDLQQMIIFTLVTFTVTSYEIALGIVRVQDYYAASAGQVFITLTKYIMM
jgi:phosphatidylglycerophosphate synthase